MSQTNRAPSVASIGVSCLWRRHVAGASCPVHRGPCVLYLLVCHVSGVLNPRCIVLQMCHVPGVSCLLACHVHGVLNPWCIVLQKVLYLLVCHVPGVS